MKIIRNERGTLILFFRKGEFFTPETLRERILWIGEHIEKLNMRYKEVEPLVRKGIRTLHSRKEKHGASFRDAQNHGYCGSPCRTTAAREAVHHYGH